MSCPTPCNNNPIPICVQRTLPIKPDRVYIPPDTPFNNLTTYRGDYYPKCFDKAQSFKPASLFDPSDAQFNGISSYRVDYYPKCTVREKSYKPTVQANFSDAPMKEISTYRNDYHLKCGPRSVSLKPATEFSPSGAKMEDRTTYRSAFTPFCPREYKFAKQPYANKLQGGDFSCRPFEGVSTYRNNFWEKPIIKTDSLKPRTRPRFSDAKFDGHSTYRNDYNPFTFGNCEPNCNLMYNRCGMYACGAEPEEEVRAGDEEMCPPNPLCGGNCGDGPQVSVTSTC